VAIAATVGRETVLVVPHQHRRGAEELESLALRPGDAVVLCDHDAPDAPRVLRSALASDASYVAMMASRGRAAGLLADLGDEGAPGLDKLHVPAGLDTGGKTAGEIALSVVAEIVAESHGRRGGPLREG
jgi:xanthine dehydrogenase accessory factor